DEEDIEIAREPGASHFAPLGFPAGAAVVGGAPGAEIFIAVAVFQRGFDLVRSHERAIARIFDAIHVNAERDDIPLVIFVFADVDVVAHHGALFAGTAEPQLHGRFGADVREVDGGVPGAGDALD